MPFLRQIVMFLIIVITNKGLCDEGTQGIFINKTKLVFSSHLNKIVLRVVNNTADHYLLQAVIQNYDPKTGMAVNGNQVTPFMVSPPLHELRAGDDIFLSLLVVPSRATLLPSNRESLYYLTLRLIPSEIRMYNSVKLHLVTAYNIRVYWRPKLDPINGKDIYFSCNNGELNIFNRSGYYREVTQLFIDNFKIKKSILIRPVPPYGKLGINTSVQHCSPGVHQASWRFRDDSGVPSDLYQMDF